MNSFLNYMIEANIGLLMFLAAYVLILKTETSYRFTRFFLLAGIFASVIFPLIHAHFEGEASIFSVGRMLPSLSLPERAVEDSTLGTSLQEASRVSLWMWIYASVSLLLAVGFAIKLYRIFNKIFTSHASRRGKFRICESNSEHPTFSFFNFIFIGESHLLTQEEKEQIVRHEVAHANHYHSIDIIALQLVRIFFWFNPFLSAYKNAIVQTHEFEADAIATKAIDSNKYCGLLAKISLRSSGFALANHFNHSLTLKRIAMIRSVKNKISLWKTSVCCAVIPAAFLLLSCQDQLRGVEGGPISETVDEHAYPKEGMEHFYDEVKRNIRYPATARKNHSAGQVLVQFVVNEDGSVSDIEVIESPDETLAEEGRRIMSLSPEWIPARRAGIAVEERIVMPIQFKLSGVTTINDDAVLYTDAHSLSEIFVVGYTK